MAFTKEILQGLGLSDEQVKGVMVEHGKDVNELKEHNSTLTAERDSFKSQVDEVTKNLDAAKKNAEKGSEAQQQVEELQQQLKDSEKQAQEQLKSQQKAFSIDKTLSDAGAKNNKAVLANIDTDKISFDENGHLIGLNDQIKALQDDESTNFLFNKDDGNQGKKPDIQIFQQGNPGRGSNTSVNLSKMTYKEQLELKQSNPEQYEAAQNELQGGNN